MVKCTHTFAFCKWWHIIYTIKEGGFIMNNTTKKVVFTGLFGALVFLGTYVHIPIYYPGGKTMVHLGTTLIFLAAIFLGKYAGLAGGIGSGLYDLLDPAYASMAIFTFIIKGLTGYVAGKIAFSGNNKGNKQLINILGFILGGLTSLVGYFILNFYLYGLPGAVLRLSSSLITTGIAIVITTAVSLPLKQLLNKSGISMNK